MATMSPIAPAAINARIRCVFGRVAQHVAHAEEHPRGRRRGDRRRAIDFGAGQRLLAQDVVAGGGERLDRQAVVTVLGGDDHGVGDPLGGDEVVPVGERRLGPEAEGVGDLVAVEGAWLGDLHDVRFAAMVGGDRRGVDRAAAAQPDECDAEGSLEWPAEVVGDVDGRARG